MNNKGFMMAEVIVVSAVVILAIVGLYESYNKIYSTYSTRVDYYDSNTLYRLAYYRDILITNNVYGDLIKNANDSGKILIYKSNSLNSIFQIPDAEKPENETDTVYLIKKTSLNSNVLNSEGISLTFKDYMEFLSNQLKKDNTYAIDSNYIMVMERCTLDSSNNKDIDDCKYGYLEIYDGNEKTP